MNIVVADTSQIGEARRGAGVFARAAGMSEVRTGQFVLVVTELATNIVKHGGGGQILFGDFHDADGKGIQCIALDRGKGMADLGRCLRDGYSTAGTTGNGLGAVVRQADIVKFYAHPGLGTAVLARFVTEKARDLPVTVGAAMTIYPGETVSGDGWHVRHRRSSVALLLADGSGHGASAHQAVIKAVDILDAHQSDDCERLLEAMHQALKPTRGAAVALAFANLNDKSVSFAGVGNIAASIVRDGESQHMISYNGIVGYATPRIRRFDFPLQDQSLLIFHSDGVSTRWKLDDYPNLADQHPALIAGVLLRDHQRGRDDATVVAMRVAL